MTNNKDTYFNFPICLIEGIFENKVKCLNDIFEYTIYAYADKLEFGTQKDRIKAALDYFGVTGSVSNGKLLFDSIPANSPKTNIKKDLYFDYYQNDKTEFEIAVFCAYCAIRSILLFKPYCKITDNYLLVRMAGKATVKEIDNLPEQMKKYASRYQLDKLKKELRNNWKLKIYGKHTRGFYISFTLELPDLIFEVERKRKKYIEKHFSTEQAEARKAALKRLYEPKISPDEITYIKALIKDKPNGSYQIESLSPKQLEAMKYIVENNLLPELELTFSPDYKTIVVKHK